MDVRTRNREDLKGYFVKNAIPTQSQFADFIDATLNQRDDGIAKFLGRPLSLQALGDVAGEPVLELYRQFTDDQPAWRLSLNPMRDPNDPLSARPGLNISSGSGNSQLFIDSHRGFVGINTIDPSAALEVQGTIKATLFEGDGSKLKGVSPSKWLDGAKSGDIHYNGGNVGIGTDKPRWKLEVNGNLAAEIIFARTIRASRIEYDGTPFTSTGAGASLPTGTIIAFAGATPPDGFLWCDGRAVSRTEYADLFTVIDGLYGYGDGSSTFNLPDLGNKFIRGAKTEGESGDVANSSGYQTNNLAKITVEDSQNQDNEQVVFVRDSGEKASLFLNKGDDNSKQYKLSYELRGEETYPQHVVLAFCIKF